LLLNAAISAAFFVTGLVGDSSALIANGVDNLSDAAVYALSIAALTRVRCGRPAQLLCQGSCCWSLPSASLPMWCVAISTAASRSAVI
jgi:hypothetical protein